MAKQLLTMDVMGKSQIWSDVLRISIVEGEIAKVKHFNLSILKSSPQNHRIYVLFYSTLATDQCYIRVG
jgi:hypothetical protein